MYNIYNKLCFLYSLADTSPTLFDDGIRVKKFSSHSVFLKAFT